MKIVDRRPWYERALESLDEEPDGWGAKALAPLSSIYATGARVLRRIRTDHPIPGPVPSIGIGNLRVGGTGKSPVVADLASRLVESGRRVAVVTRGYRGAEGGDEPRWLEDRGLVVMRDADRVRGAEAAVRNGADVVLLDDALQTRHRPALTIALLLARDLGRAPRCLPAGPAREGSEGLRRAQHLAVRLEGPESAPAGCVGFRLVPTALVDMHGRTEPLEALAAKGRCVLASGIARPRSFEEDARAAGAAGVVSWRETDHWNPNGSDATELGRLVEEVGASWILCPEKNLLRLSHVISEVPVVALRSEVRWESGVDPLDAFGIRRLLGA